MDLRGEGAPVMRAPGSKFIHFHAVHGENLAKLASPPLALAPSCLENPGSATAWVQ